MSKKEPIRKTAQVKLSLPPSFNRKKTMSMRQNDKAQKAMQTMTEQMINRIEAMRANGTDTFALPWFEIKGRNFCPQNVSGRKYSGINAFFLALITYGNNYNTPCFCTFSQAKEKGWNIKKGEKSAPISFFKKRYFDKETGEEVTEEDYKETPNLVAYVPTIVYYNVFNIDQTTAEESVPEEYKALCAQFKEEIPQNIDTYSDPNFDRLIEEQKWICPINLEPKTEAFYSIKDNAITLPCKRLFKQAYSFYSTLSHEMVHSTIPIFKRPQGQVFGDKVYAREELIAELGASIVALRLGFSSYVAEDNASYLSGWLKGLREEPQYLLEIVTEVQKATSMIFSHLGISNWEE